MSLRARLITYAWKSALVLGVMGVGLWVATHGIAGVSWGQVASVIGSVDVWHLILLTAIWISSLCIYSLVLAAALPGLGIRRGLLLNLSGSAVANVMPFGGAAATALNWRMVRSWGHSDSAFVAFCVLTNSLDVLFKLLLPVVAAATLLALELHVPLLLWIASAACGVGFCGGFALLLVATRSDPAEQVAGSRWRTLLSGYVRDSGARIHWLLLKRWPRLLPASLAYVATHVLLLYFSLRSVGIVPAMSVLLTAAAIERLGTVIPLTPGGAGIAELGTIAWLVANGLDPVAVVAGVLLYRLVLVALDVPVGAVLLAGWAWMQRTAGGRRTSQVAV